jgi:RNA polymerase sigma factor (sigma-70 family)
LDQVFTSDAEIVNGCQRGRQAAWDCLFDKYYGVVARFVFQLSGDFSHEDTEEICQETFLSVVRNLKSFQARSSLQTWLLRIAANKAMDYRAKTRTLKRGGNVTHATLDDIDPISPSLQPDTSLLDREKLELVRYSLDQLDASCRELIELSYYGDLSYSEIGAELRINPKTVSSRLSRCLDRLGAIAKKIFPTEQPFAV